MISLNGQYIYACGRLSVLFNHLLGWDSMERMVDSPDARGAVKVLNDLDYANNLPELQGKNIENFQDDLDAELLDVYGIALSQLVCMPLDGVSHVLYLWWCRQWFVGCI